MSTDNEQWLDLAVKAAQEADLAYSRSRLIDGRGWAGIPEDQIRRLLRAGIRSYMEWSKPVYQHYEPRNQVRNQ